MTQIPAEWEDYVAEQVASGRFANPVEVIVDALSQQRDDHRRLVALRREVQKGLDDVEAGRISHATADDIIARVKQRQRQKSA